MSWQTLSTPIVTRDDGIEAVPPPGGPWEPIGTHEGHVVWRTRTYSKEDTAHATGMVEVLDGVLAESFRERADLIAEIARLRKCHVDRLRELRRRFAATETTLKDAAQKSYSRGYNTASRRRKREEKESYGPPS